jgi:hypothetical protein
VIFLVGSEQVMSDGDLDKAIRAARNSLGHPPGVVEFPTADWSQSSGEDDLSPNPGGSDDGGDTESAAQTAAAGGNRGATGDFPPSDPVWTAVRSLKSLCDLLPATPAGKSRLGQCVDQMRRTAERELFSNADSLPSGAESLNPVEYPRLEINKAVGETRHLMLALLPQVEFERRLRELLARELSKSDEFLDEDDRGTIQGRVEPSGPTSEKMRNDTKLHALGVFLDALGRQPFAAVRCAVALLSQVAVPPDVLSVDARACVVTFRSMQYRVPDLTAHFVGLLLEADGGLVSTADVARAAGVAGQVRADRLKEKLPDALVAAIKTTQKGSWLDKDRLLSHA